MARKRTLDRQALQARTQKLLASDPSGRRATEMLEKLVEDGRLSVREMDRIFLEAEREEYRWGDWKWDR